MQKEWYHFRTFTQPHFSVKEKYRIVACESKEWWTLLPSLIADVKNTIKWGRLAIFIQFCFGSNQITSHHEGSGNVFIAKIILILY